MSSNDDEGKPAARQEVHDCPLATDPEQSSALAGANERLLKWKLDLFILPLLVSIFFLAVIGQSNIGNAYQAGLAEDLSLTPKMFANVNSLFLVGYVVGQLPATLLLRQLGPQRQFAGAMVSWGLLTIGASYAKNYGTLVVCRVLIAVAESMIQGAVLYLSFWYRYEELATRASVLSATNALAGTFSGLLAYAIQKDLDGRNGWRAWRWIFLIEGVLPVGWSVIILLLLPSTPNSIRRGFSPAEKTLLLERAALAHNTGNNKVVPRLILRVLAEPQFWFIASIQSGLLLCSSSTANFLPAIMAGLGYEGVQAQLMSAIPYAVSFAAILVLCRLSDLSRLRGIWIIGCCLVTAVGYIVLLTTTKLAGRLIATCLITAGANAPATICFAWMASVNVGYTFRGSALALINIMAHLVSLGGQQAFTVALAVALFTAASTVLLMLYFRWLNAEKRREQHSENSEKLRALSIDEIGNRHPDFFFSF
ncbi:hypothetical protein PG994_008172 [Apiospora phragmitis]|uniref:Major facilitator superfamily (MFS) profile domain-containing protein n=1 Tax=Apiospora phragmitis TaxID=2905665 RepID=A0ABR1UUP3_9PEZI